MKHITPHKGNIIWVFLIAFGFFLLSVHISFALPDPPEDHPPDDPHGPDLLALDFASLLDENDAADTTSATCLEVPLPNLPGLTVDPCSSPAAYIQYWFYFSLYLAGIAALVIFVIAGAWRIFFATSPSSVGKSNQWMINAVLGLILLFGSWLLLRTLGGAGLTTIRDPVLPKLPALNAPIASTEGGDCIVNIAIDTEVKKCASGLSCIFDPATCSGLSGNCDGKCHDGSEGDPCNPTPNSCQSPLNCTGSPPTCQP